MSLVGKAAPDFACEIVGTKTKTTLKKLMKAKVPTVICFVSKTQSPHETNAAVNSMEEGAFQKKEAAVFIIVSLDSQKGAQELHATDAIKKSAHVFSSTNGKEYGVTRTPAHVVIGADGKVKMQTEEEAAAYMSFLT